MSKAFVFPVRVYYEDTDAAGIVYHANYVKFMDRARTQWCSELGYSLHDLAKQGYLFTVKEIKVHYIRPAKLGYALEVLTQLKDTNNVRFIMEQTIIDAEDNEIIYCKGLVTLVSINKDLRPCKMIPEVAERMNDGL